MFLIFNSIYKIYECMNIYICLYFFKNSFWNIEDFKWFKIGVIINIDE